MKLPLIIIGSGLAGYMLAKEWRKGETQTPLIMITADDGVFYSKPLLSTALTQKKTPEQLAINTAETLSQELNAKIYTQSVATAIDPIAHTVTVHSQSFAFSKLVLACGAEVISPPLSGNAVAEIQTVNNLSDYRHFRQWLTPKKHIAILGTGLVGCEFANDLMNAGYTVTLISPDAYPLMRLLPKAIGSLLQDSLTKQGALFKLGHFPTTVNAHGSQKTITLSNGQEILVDGVFSAIGLRPNISLAQSAGIRVNQGIVVDPYHRTNFPDIFALGDCAEVNGLVQMYVAPLLQSARALAKILIGNDEPVRYPVMPIIVKTPVLPLVFVSPPADALGEWRMEGEGLHLRALFYDSSAQLRGFALSGDKIRDKIPLMQQLTCVFAE